MTARSFLAASVHGHVDVNDVEARRVWDGTAMTLAVAGLNVYTAKTTAGPDGLAASGALFRTVEAAAREVAEWCEREAAVRAAVARDWGDAP